MSKSSTVKSSDQMDSERRAVKQRQNAKARAAKSERVESFSMLKAMKAAEHTRRIQAERAEQSAKTAEIVKFVLGKVRKNRSILVSYGDKASREIYAEAESRLDLFVVRNRSQKWFRIFVKSVEWNVAAN